MPLVLHKLGHRPYAHIPVNYIANPTTPELSVNSYKYVRYLPTIGRQKGKIPLL